MRNRVGFGRLVLAVAAAGFCLIASAGPAHSKSIFDDDYPSSKETVPAPKPPATIDPPHSSPVPPPGNEPSSVVPPAVPPENPGTGVVDENMMPGLVAELYEKGQLKEAKVVKRIRIFLTATADKPIPLVFKWHGLINIPTGGMSVVFRVNTLASGELMLDGKKVADERGGASLKLAEGPHTIAVTVAQITGHGVKEEISLRWTPADEELQTVPSAVFFHTKKEEPAGVVAAAGADPGHGGTPAVPGIPASSGVPAGTATPPTARKPAIKVPGELAVPSDSQLVELHKAIRTKYAADYADPARIVRQALVKKLIGAASQRGMTTPERYALLKEAADLSVATGDLKTAMACVDAISVAYKVNEADLTLGVLTTAAHLPKSLAIGHEVGDAAMALSNRAKQENEIDQAVRAAQLAETAYGSDSADAAYAKSALKDLREIQVQYARVAPLLKKLKETPDDQDLNGRAGRYFCFNVGNWEKGLPMLARGSDPALKALAGVESTPPADADGQLKLGDDWWDKSASETPTSATGCKDRAAFWYDHARAGMKEGIPQRVIDRLSTLSRNLDLLSTIKIEDLTTRVNNGVAGEHAVRTTQTDLWTRDHDALICKSGFYAAALQLPYRPAGEYDFIVEFTIAKGSGSIAQMLPVRGSLLQWEVRGDFANFGPVALRRGSFGPILKGRVPIVAGQKYTSVVQFRRNGIRGYLNNVLIRDWSTDYSEVGASMEKLPDPQCIGIKASGDEVIISAIRVIEIGHGGN